MSQLAQQLDSMAEWFDENPDIPALRYWSAGMPWLTPLLIATSLLDLRSLVNGERSLRDLAERDIQGIAQVVPVAVGVLQLVGVPVPPAVVGLANSLAGRELDQAAGIIRDWLQQFGASEEPPPLVHDQARPGPLEGPTDNMVPGAKLPSRSYRARIGVGLAALAGLYLLRRG